MNLVWTIDQAAQRLMQGGGLQGSTVAQLVAEGANWWGGDGVIVFAVLLWLGGRAMGRNGLSRVGLRGLEGLVIASAISAVGKGLFGRARPFVTPGEPWHFEFSRGWSEAQFFSMPSGHTTATIAFVVGAVLATASWPAGRRAALGMPLAVSVLLVGIGRMYANQHWLSDVIVALALGSVTSVLLARLHRRVGDGAYARAMLGAGALGVGAPGAPGASARVIVAVAAMVVAAATSVAAQSDTARHGPLMTRRDAGILGGATVASIVLMGSDLRIAERVRASPLQRPGAARSVLDAGKAYGDPGVFIASGVLWGAGRLMKDRAAERIGLRSFEAVLVSGAFTGVLKAVAGRARPSQSPGNARDFAIARGLRDGSEFQSFPSGHATAAFAFAAAVDAEWTRLSPTRPKWVAPVLYGMAALTAVSRVYHDRHWTSDVVLGSAIGFVSGRAVVRWHADRR